MSVYFVTAREVGAVKIGFSVEPRARLPEIQWGCPLALTLEAVLPGGHPEESRLHRWFAEERITGEWFRLTDMIELIIKNNAVPHLTGLKRELKSIRKPRKRPWHGKSDEEKYAALMAEMRANDEPVDRFYSPVAAGFGQFNDRFCVRGGGRRFCDDLRLTWDQADRLCDIFEQVRRQAQRPLDLELTRQREKAA